MTEDFYPCNDRERDILEYLLGSEAAQKYKGYPPLESYKAARHAGATVSEALVAIGLPSGWRKES